MQTETIGVTVTYKEPLTFHLRMIGIDAENKLRQQMFGLSEAEKAEKQYQINVDMLAHLTESDEQVLNVEGHFNSAEAVRSYFADKTVVKERIAEYAVRGYFVKLQPDVSFS